MCKSTGAYNIVVLMYSLKCLESELGIMNSSNHKVCREAVLLQNATIKDLKLKMTKTVLFGG